MTTPTAFEEPVFQPGQLDALADRLLQNDPTVVSVCTGVGGLDMGLEMVLGPLRRLWYSEFDPDASRVMEHRYPGLRNIGDLTKLSAADWAALPRPQILTAGFPCQDLSAAGKRAGIRKGTRSGVWAYIAEAIGILRPEMVIIENVLGLLSSTSDRGVGPTDPYVEAAGEHALRAAGRVLGDLADLGFDAEWKVVAASEGGAVHRRLRVFIKAWPAHLPRPRLDRWRNVAVAADAQGLGQQSGGLPFGAGPTFAESGFDPNGADTRDLILLPTPDTGYSLNGHGRLGGKAGNGHQSGNSLEATVTALLPTPTARDSVRGAGWGDLPGRPLSETIMRLLPTPAARLGDRWGMPNADTAARRMGEEGRRNLEDAIALLPDWDHDNGGQVPPRAELALLPTPMAADGGTNRGSSSGHGLRNTSRLIPDTWGVYAPAVHRWEAVVGRPAPSPTEPGDASMRAIRRWAHNTGLDGYSARALILAGQVGARLSARFVEWMVGLPEGWVIDILDRSAALKCLGNIAMPHQTARAIHHLMTTGAASDEDVQ